MNRTFVTLPILGLALVFACSSPEGERSERRDSASAAVLVDITDQRGLKFVHDPGVDSTYYMPESIGSGGAFLDYDNDGDLDIYLLNGARRGALEGVGAPLRNRLFRQEPDGSFLDVTESSGLGDTGYGMGVAAGDIDNDGDVDVYISNFGPDALYRNNGDGTFTDISVTAGISNAAWGASVALFDFDLDGWLDIYVSNYVNYDTSVTCTDEAGRPDYCGPAAFRGVADVLYRNAGGGVFVDVSVVSGIGAASSKGLGVVSFDFNRDTHPDVYVANDGEPNHLWINQGDGTFVDRAVEFGAAVNAMGHPEAGMGIAVSDLDDDADFDLFVTHLRAETNTLYRNVGEHGFEDQTRETGLATPSIPYTGFGTGFVDYDHDGDLDLILVNGRVTRGPLLTSNDPPRYWDYYSEPNLVLENDGRGGFRDVSPRMPAFSGYIENSRGLAFGDVDNDGDIDLLVTNEGGRAQLIGNEGQKGHWLMIEAIDPRLRRYAVGAEITVVVGERRLLRLLTPSYSFLSSNDPRVHFGLGAATAVDSIRVRWPGGDLETFPGAAADQMITLRRGAGAGTDE